MRSIKVGLDVVNHRLPSAPRMIVFPGETLSGVGTSVTVPVVVIRPTSPETPVNQSVRSGPVVIPVAVTCVGVVPAGELGAKGIVGRANSVVVPEVVIRPISPARPVNQSAPSGPTVIAFTVVG